MARRRGRPILMLLTLAFGWIGARIWTWDYPPLDDRKDDAGMAHAHAPAASTGPATTRVETEPAMERPLGAVGTAVMANAGPRIERFRGIESRFPARFPGETRMPKEPISRPVATTASAIATPEDVSQRSVSLAPGGMSSDPAVTSPPANSRRRLTLNAWAFWRQGSDDLATTIGRSPTYGASQLGGVLQYRLDPASRNDPRLFLRAYRALVTQGETELSAGASARPLRGVPLRLHAEVRATERLSAARREIDLRPAIFATSELAPLQLPLGSRFEAYAQAGYVGGNGATAFADGQMSVIRDAARFSFGRLSGGAGAWAGAQEGTSRVDIGPILRFDTELGKVPVRVAADYRARVAGDAKPDSGFAVTLSSGF